MAARRMIWRQIIIVIAKVHMPAGLKLFQIIQALCLNGLLPGFRKGGQEHRSQNRDDGDDNEEFDQSKATGLAESAAMAWREWQRRIHSGRNKEL